MINYIKSNDYKKDHKRYKKRKFRLEILNKGFPLKTHGGAGGGRLGALL